MAWLMGKSRKNRDSSSSSNEDCRVYLRQDFIRERLIDADISPLVSLPHRVDYNEWLASNTLSFFEHVNSISSCLVEFCQPSASGGGCLAMTGPGNVHYLWVDDRGKKCKCSAAQYIDYAMSFAQKSISDESIFPTKYGNHFPSSFEKVVRKIHRLLLHVIAHIYQSHSRETAALGLLGHLNTVACHFLLFNRRFNLTENKETNVLDDLFERLLLHSNDQRRGEDIVQLNLQNFSVLRDFESSSAATSASMLLQKSGIRQPLHQSIRPLLAAKENDGGAAFICGGNAATCGLVA